MSQIKNPKVTVLINNYNYGRYLDKAIESALQQTYKNTEILVVDDGSTDNSPEVMKRYGKFITPVFKSNGGQASAVNKGFDSITGDYVFFLDADDYWDINKIEKCMEVFHMNKACGYVHHNMKVIDEKDHIIDLLKKDKLYSGWLSVDKDFSIN
jgi:glycosyltransferase involved in cell wall biosynthesis